MAISVFHITSFMWVRERPVEINWNSLKKEQQGKQENEAKELEKTFKLRKNLPFARRTSAKLNFSSWADDGFCCRAALLPKRNDCSGNYWQLKWTSICLWWKLLQNYSLSERGQVDYIGEWRSINLPSNWGAQNFYVGIYKLIPYRHFEVAQSKSRLAKLTKCFAFNDNGGSIYRKKSE